MMNAGLGGDGADGPVLGVEEAANLGVLRGRDHRAAPGTRDERARAVEGARRCPGHRPCIATHAPGARSAPRPSSCPGAVWRARRRAGKSDPSRGPGTRADGRDDRCGLRGWCGGVGARRGSIAGGPPCDRPPSNTRGRDRTRRRSRRGGHNGGRSSGEAARPRRRSGIAARLDTATKPWHNRADWLGPSEHRGSHRGSGGISSRPSTSLAAASAYGITPRSPTRPITPAGGTAASAQNALPPAPLTIKTPGPRTQPLRPLLPGPELRASM
jgi:hypothetical protein